MNKELPPHSQVLSVLVVVGSLCMLAYLGYLIKRTPVVGVAEYIQILIFMAIVLTLIFTIFAQIKSSQNTESASYLSTSIELINRAYSVLCDDNGKVISDRVSWVTAARLLRRSELIAKNIVLTSHKLIYTSEKDYQRHRFNSLLSLDGGNLPVEFFFGNGFVKNEVGRSACNTIAKGEAEWIPTRIVSEVYRFKSYPPDYDDPLSEAVPYKEVDLQREPNLFDQDGVAGYLRFREHFFASGDTVFHKDPITGLSEVDPAQIDSLLPRVLLSTPLSADEI